MTAEQLVAGFARKDITPALGTPSGLSLRMPVDDIWDPLLATVLVLEAEGRRVVVVGLDLMGILEATHREIRARVGLAVGVDPNLVVLNASHTHSAPYLSAELQELLRPHGLRLMDDAYAESVSGAVAEGAAEAASRLTAVDVAVGRAAVDRVAANRRARLRDGRVVHRYGRPPIELRELDEGLIDPEVAVARFVESNGSRLVGSVAIYACHPTAAGGDYHGHVSADFVGPGRALVEAELGAPLLFLQGCGGDCGTGKWVAGTAREDTTAMGERFAASVIAASRLGTSASAPGLRVATEEIALELEGVDDVGDLERRFLAAAASDDMAQIVALGDRLVIARRVDELRRARITALALGDIAIVVLPGEVFVEHGLAIRAGSPFETTIVAAYNDNTIQYVPTAAAFPDGEYEVHGGWRYIRPGQGERMVATATRMLGDIAARSPVG